MKSQKSFQLLDALYAVFLMLSLCLVNSCAHDPKLEKEIESEVQQQPIESFAEREQSARQTIADAPLSEKQKARLKEITDRASAEIKALREEESKLRLLLIKQFVNPDVSDREIDAIKRRILETNQKNNKYWLDALDEARKVIGRRSEQDAKFYRTFMQETTPRLEKNSDQ